MGRAVRLSQSTPAGTVVQWHRKDALRTGTYTGLSRVTGGVVWYQVQLPVVGRTTWLEAATVLDTTQN